MVLNILMLAMRKLCGSSIEGGTVERLTDTLRPSRCHLGIYFLTCCCHIRYSDWTCACLCDYSSERGLPEDNKPIKRSRSDQSLTTAVLLGGSSCHDYSLAVQYGGQAHRHPPSPFTRCTRPTLPVVLSDHGSSTNSLVSLDSDMTRSSTSLPALQALLHAASGGLPPTSSVMNISTLTQVSSAVSLYQAQAHMCPELVRVESEVSMDASSETAGGGDSSGEGAGTAGKGLAVFTGGAGSEGSSVGASPSSSQACIAGILSSSGSSKQQQQRPPMGRSAFGGSVRARLQAFLPSSLLRGASGELKAAAGAEGGNAGNSASVSVQQQQQRASAAAAGTGRNQRMSCPGGTSSRKQEAEVFVAGSSPSGGGSWRSLSSPGRTTSSPLSSSSGGGGGGSTQGCLLEAGQGLAQASSCPSMPAAAATVEAGAAAKPITPPAVACIHTLQANLLQPVVPPAKKQASFESSPPRTAAPAAAGASGGNGARFSGGIPPAGAFSSGTFGGFVTPAGGSSSGNGSETSSHHRHVLGDRYVTDSFTFAPLPGPAAAAAVAATPAAHAGHGVPPFSGAAAGGRASTSSSTNSGMTWGQAAEAAAAGGGQEADPRPPVAAAGGGSGSGTALQHTQSAPFGSSAVFSAPLPGGRVGLPVITRGASIGESRCGVDVLLSVNRSIMQVNGLSVAMYSVTH